MFERALCTTVAFAAPIAADLRVVEMDAVREQRPLVERPRAGEPLDDASPVPGERVALVGAVLGGVDVETGRELVRRAGAGGERLVAERERGVRADEAARERRLLPAHALEPAPVLRQAGARPLGAVAVGRLVAEHRADAEGAERVGDHVERAVDRVRRRVMVDERRRTREERLHPAGERRRAHRLLVERAVEPPPHALQDLDEVPGRLERVRHPARERGVEVRVRADVARDDEDAVAVEPRPFSRSRDAAVCDPEVAGVEPDGIEGRDDHVWALVRWGTAASAAGESFIGRRVRRMPSKA